MIELPLQRTVHDPHCSLGRLTLPSGLVLASIERPWVKNAPTVSCIPAGKYKCAWTLSPRFHRKTYEVLDVPGRSGIRIHAANWASQLEGCIALGITHGAGCVIQSKIAIDKFEAELNGQPFILNILPPTN